MTVGRVFRKASLQQQDRLPLSTYEDAVARLVQFRCNDAIEDAAYDLAVEVVADIFWKTDKQVRRDVAVAARKIGGRE